MSREIKFRHIKPDGSVEFNQLNREMSGGYIEQYTGLKDKDGKEIYDGDLIKVSDAPALKDKTLIVKFGEYHIDEYACTAMSGWLVQVVNSDWTASLLDEVDKCEVIGNVHEPPKDFRPEHLKRMGVSVSKGGGE